jgi:phage shock protein E
MGFLNKLFGMGGTNSTDLAAAIKGGALLIDVRSPGEFKTGSVKGAINIPVDSLTNKQSQFKGRETIVVFCRSGNRSRMAKGILQQLGIPNVIDGGTWENVASIRKEVQQ